MNRLSQELSPYLLQHAHQKINWFPWSKEAFDKAKALDKPILLSIGYATCHWCHVMSHESFDDEAIAQLMNEHFICIKLDREERPDIDHIYMTAVNVMTGSGGWPLNVFLTPDAKPFYGGTYFPPVARHGLMAFGDLLLAVHQAWVNNRPQLLTSAQDLIISLNQHMGRSNQSGQEIGQDQLLKAYQHLSADFDHEHGGFNKSPKFPMGHVLWFLMRYYHFHRDPQALFMVEKTLTAMATGGIYDHIGGGFHRYSVDECWHVPHFEKMLYDQAFLLRAYTECYQETGQLFYAKTALGIARYVLREMTSSRGGFYCAQDADSEDNKGHHVEGAFYVFTSKEIIEVLGQEEGELFNRTFGVEEQGNVAVDPHGDFVGKNILFRQQLNQQDEDRIYHAISKLLDWRNLRKKPLLDDKILADLNGLMIASMAFAGQVLDQPHMIDAARQAADFVWKHMRQSEQLLHRWRNGHLAHAATIDDYAYLAQGFLVLYEITFEESYLVKAQWLVDKLINDFTDSDGGFFMTASQADDVIVRPKDLGDGALASGNSIAAIVLVRLFALTGEERYQVVLKDVFKGFAHLLMTRPSSLTGLWCAWMHMEHGGMEILCHGDPHKGEIAKMVKLLYKDFNPFVVVKAKLEAEVPCVYVCRQRVCHQPVTKLEDFQVLITS